jgi:hypothetical protein
MSACVGCKLLERSRSRAARTTRAACRRLWLYSLWSRIRRAARKTGLVERDREGSSEDEIKPIDWLVPVS